MIDSNNAFVFQTDSELARIAYQTKDNYLIEYDEAQSKEYCAVYFSSNDIYYPNTEKALCNSIFELNKFEWFNLRVPYASKHIFIRDIHKQWYLTGINSIIDSPDKLLHFLRDETAGYEITSLGSSAGGFAAVLYGSLLNARLILSFNGQFQIKSLLNTSQESVNPIIFRFNRSNKYLKYFDIKPFVKESRNIFYFFSNASLVDCEQYRHIQDMDVNVVQFSTSHHGIPFLKCNLPVILKMTNIELALLSGKVFAPFLFSLKMVGVVNTFKGLFEQLKKKYL